MKLILIVGLCAITRYIGYLLSKQYKLRRDLYVNLKDFVDKISAEIKFKNLSVKDVCLANEKSYNGEFGKVIKSYLKCLDEKKDFSVDQVGVVKNYTDEERNLITNFFNSLGKFDLKTQIKDMDNFKCRFEEYCEEAKAEYKKYSSLFIKLGLIIGLAISIIII